MHKLFVEEIHFKTFFQSFAVLKDDYIKFESCILDVIIKILMGVW